MQAAKRISTRRRELLGAALGTTAALAAPYIIAQPAPIKWKMQSLWQAGTLPHKIFEAFCADVGKKSGGKLLIEAKPVNSIVAAAESFDAVGAGVLDGQHSGPAYNTGKDVAFALMSDLSGGYDNVAQMQEWMEKGGGLQLAREIYGKYGVRFVGGVWWNYESLPSKKPLRKVEDFKGLKMRVPPGVGQDIFKQLGAAPVNIPGSDIYTALERGVIDATDWGTLSMNQDLGFHKFCKYPIYPGLHSMPMSDVAVNANKWKALPPDLQAVVETAVRDFAGAMSAQMSAADKKVAQQAEQLGFEPIAWSDQERRRFRAVAMQVCENYAKRSANARKVFDSQLALLKAKGLI